MDQEIQQELLPSSERFETADEMVALHVRMAISEEALKPTNLELPEIKAEQLTNLNQTIAIAANGSTKERVGYWENEWQKMIAKNELLASLDGKGKLEKEKAVWVKQMIQDFKSTVNKDYVNRLKLKNIGGIDLNNFNQETANQIYQRYFADQGQGETVEVVLMTENGQEKTYISSNLNQFIDDVIEKYNKDYDLIVKDLDALEWYAGIFGSATEEERLSGETPKKVHANEVIKELIHTRIKLENEAKKQELIEQAKETKKVDGQPTTRPNWLNEKEEPILTWLHQASQLKRKIVPRQPVSQPEVTEPPPQPAHPELTPQAKPEPLRIKPTKPITIQSHPSTEQQPAIPENIKQYYYQQTQALCNNLRTRLRDEGKETQNPLTRTDREGEPPVQQFKYCLTDSRTGISLPVNSRQEAMINNFDGGSFNVLLDKYKIPLILLITEGAHANFLLKGPHQDQQNRWVITIYDPMQKGEQNILLTQQLSFDQWMTQGISTGKIEKSPDPKEYLYQYTTSKISRGLIFKTIPEVLKLNRQELFRYYCDDVFPVAHSDFNSTVLEALYDGSYNLSIADDPEIPTEVKEAINQVTQTGSNCIPLSFVSGLARFLVLPGDPRKQRQIADIVKKDFGITILTREQILAGIKPVETAAGTTSIEAKSFTDILETIKEKAKTGQPCEMQFNEEGLKMILDSLIPSIELKKDPITANFELIQPAEVAISDQQGTIKLPLRIKAGPLGKLLGEPEVTLSLTLDEQLNYASVKSEPEEVFGQNVSQKIQQKPLSFYLKDHLQKQLDQQNASIDIESVGLQFTPDNLLSARIKAKKNK